MMPPAFQAGPARRDGPVRCAVAGLGRIGSSLETDRLREKPASHAGAIRANPDAVLGAGADPDPAARESFAALWDLPTSALFPDAASMLDAAKPDILHIACDTDAHVPLLRLALDRRVPVVVLEKPVARSLAEARRVLREVERAEREGRSRVVVNHERRFARDWRRAREIVRSGEYGPLRSAHARLYMGMSQRVDAVLWHDGTHLADVLRFVLGPWRPVSVRGDVRSSEGNVLVVGETPERGAGGPVTVTIEASPGRDHLLFECDLSFASGRVRVGNGVFEEWKSAPSPLYERFRSLESVTSIGTNPYAETGYFAGMMAHAIALARDPGLPIESSFRDGVAALEILDRIIRLGSRPAIFR